jgi:hypothetical protein
MSAKKSELVSYTDFIAAWPGDTVPKTEEQLIAAGYGVKRLPHEPRKYMWKARDLISYFNKLGYPKETLDALSMGLGIKPAPPYERKNPAPFERKVRKK